MAELERERWKTNFFGQKEGLAGSQETHLCSNDSFFAKWILIHAFGTRDFEEATLLRALRLQASRFVQYDGWLCGLFGPRLRSFLLSFLYGVPLPFSSFWFLHSSTRQTSFSCCSSFFKCVACNLSPMDFYKSPGKQILSQH